LNGLRAPSPGEQRQAQHKQHPRDTQARMISLVHRLVQAA
jgi:hypothetical protein